MSGPVASGEQAEERVLTIAISDVLWFIDSALDQMVSILRDLGDQRSCTKPELEGTNSPFAIVTHCLGVMEYWGGAVVAGRVVDRDRQAEFAAEGEVPDLARRVVAARLQLAADFAVLESTAPPRIPSPPEPGVPWQTSQGAVVVHIYEELSQHLGQLELTRDLLLAAG